jgi:hypothetical protein
LKGKDNPIQIVNSSKIFSEAEVRTAACQSLQPLRDHVSYFKTDLATIFDFAL